MIVQLKPSEESFYKLIFNKFKSLDIILLCEGKTEVNVIKTIVKELNLEIRLIFGLTDCEGIDNVQKLATIIASLAKVSRKLKNISVLIDAETMDFTDRAKSILDSLRSKGFQVDEICSLATCEHVFETQIEINSRILPLIIAVNGIKEFNFTKHSIEDHIVKLMLLEEKIDDQEISRYSEAKQIVYGDKILDIIKEANKENIESAFNHIICLINNLTSIY